MSNCIFCKIIAGEIPADIVYQDEHVLVFKDIRPKATTHLLFVPLQHVENLSALTAEHDTVITQLMLRIPQVAKQLGISDFRFIFNNGAGAGQEVFHLHGHLLSGKLKAFG